MRDTTPTGKAAALATAVGSRLMPLFDQKQDRGLLASLGDRFLYQIEGAGIPTMGQARARIGAHIAGNPISQQAQGWQGYRMTPEELLAEAMPGPDLPMGGVLGSIVRREKKAVKDSLDITRETQKGQLGSGFTDYEYTIARLGDKKATVSVGDDGIRLYPADQKRLEWADFDFNGKLTNKGEGAFVAPSERDLSDWSEIAREVASKIKENTNKLPAEDVFIRFNKIPTGGRSVNHATGEIEKGVSVYGAEKDILRGGVSYLSDGANEGAIIHYVIGGHKPYLVSGNVVGIGSDGEPVIEGAKKVADLVYSEKEGIFKIK